VISRQTNPVDRSHKELSNVLICDAAFYAMKPGKEKLGKRVYAVGIGPSVETSKDGRRTSSGCGWPGRRSASCSTRVCAS
jgi:hypothetical protein